jgi:ADP-ribose pyrophosphatase
MSEQTPSAIRTIYAGRVFTVRIETVTLPGGSRLEAEIVRHPGSVVVVPVTDRGEIVLVRQYRPAIGQHAWELPAGSVAPGENFEAAARRECQEEIGLIADRLEPLGGFFPTPGYCDERMHLYRATGLREPGPGDAPAHQDEDEAIEVAAFTPARLRAMIADGSLVDLKTVAALALIGLLGGARP